MAKKSRTQNKFENACISLIRSAWKRYSPTYGEVCDSRKVSLPRYKKDGTLSKVPDVSWQCDCCSILVKEFNIDHVDPVIPLDKTRRDFDLEEVKSRIDCENSNLQLLCKPCHKSKSQLENKERLRFGKKSSK